ncbi:MAG TPA: hypothetical protein PLH98_15415 [Ruminococcus flavefaciens]|nr:hypothetical protein [Ruminococcus flavefaciens]HQM01919.1 hypothetical protein [Ruminococcus flavefaciens]
MMHLKNNRTFRLFALFTALALLPSLFSVTAIITYQKKDSFIQRITTYHYPNVICTVILRLYLMMRYSAAML